MAVRIRGLSPNSYARLLAWNRNIQVDKTKVFFAICDHFEPMNGNPGPKVEVHRVDRWVSEYPRAVKDISDSRGRAPQHTFFYPAEEYNPHHLEKIAGICRQGLGDVEVHLHHDNDNEAKLTQTLEDFNNKLATNHGLLRRNESGQLTYGFIHGNWALNNSRHDGRWCGINDEIRILMETGCYADFTMPSCVGNTQTTAINSIYYADSEPDRPKGHDTGIPAQVGQQPPENKLLMIQGPLMLDWSRRKWGMLPSIENSDLSCSLPPSLKRFRLWLQAGVQVSGRDDWIFIKLHTHGAPEKNANVLLGEAMHQFHSELDRFAKDNSGFEYYYVTAFEMAQLAHHAENGSKDPVGTILDNSANNQSIRSKKALPS